MADCAKTVDFLREWDRMCSTHEECETCPLNSITSENDCDVSKCIEDAIAIVQKWSDARPVMTWIGKLREILPNADTTRLLTTTCPWTIFGGNAPGAGDCSKGIDDCARCWYGEYKEG